MMTSFFIHLLISLIAICIQPFETSPTVAKNKELQLNDMPSDIVDFILYYLDYDDVAQFAVALGERKNYGSLLSMRPFRYNRPVLEKCVNGMAILKHLYLQENHEFYHKPPIHFSDIGSSECSFALERLCGSTSEKELLPIKIMISHENQLLGLYSIKSCPLHIIINSDDYDSDLETITPHLQYFNLRFLDLGHFIDDKKAQVVAEALKHPSNRIHEIAAASEDLTDVGVLPILSALHHPNNKVTYFNMLGANLEGEGLSALAQALTSSHSKIKQLQIWFSELYSDSTHKVIESLAHPNNKVQELVTGWVKGEEERRLFQILSIHNCNIQILQLVNCPLEFENSKVLAASLSSPYSKVERLFINAEDIDGVDFSSISVLASVFESEYCKLTHLWLNSVVDMDNVNQFFDTLIQLLNAIRVSHHCKITHLDLENNLLDDNVLLAICKLLTSPNNKIKYLNLGRNEISSAGAILLVKTLVNDSNCQLEYLNIEFNNISKIAKSTIRNIAGITGKILL